MDSRDLEPAVFSHRFWTRGLPIAIALNTAIIILLGAALFGIGWLIAGIRFP